MSLWAVYSIKGVEKTELINQESFLNKSRAQFDRIYICTRFKNHLVLFSVVSLGRLI